MPTKNARSVLLGVAAALAVLPAARLAAQSGAATTGLTPARRATAQPEAFTCAAGGLMLRQPGARLRATGDSTDRLIAIERMQSMHERVAVGAASAAGAGGARVRIIGGASSGWIGLRTSEVSEMRWTSTDGRLVHYCDYPVVVSVDADSPAAKAGIEPGDTVVAYNGTDLREGGEIPLDRLLMPDSTLRVSVRREGRALQMPVVVGRREGTTWTSVGPNFSYIVVKPNGRAPVALPPGMPALPPGATVIAQGSPEEVRKLEEQARVMAQRTRRLGPGEAPTPPMPARPSAMPPLFAFGLGGPSALAGAQLAAVDDDLRAAIGARSNGVLVLKVIEGTVAATAGLHAGDIIVSAAGRPIDSPMGLQRALLHESEGRALELRVERKGKTRDVTLRW